MYLHPCIKAIDKNDKDKYLTEKTGDYSLLAKPGNISMSFLDIFFDKFSFFTFNNAIVPR